MNTSHSSKPQWAVVSRIVAAFLPGFALTNALGVMVVLLLPFERLSAIAWVTVLAFAFYAALIMWIFHIQSLRKVWSVLMFSLIISSLASWWLILLEKTQ